MYLKLARLNGNRYSIYCSSPSRTLLVFVLLENFIATAVAILWEDTKNSVEEHLEKVWQKAF